MPNIPYEWQALDPDQFGMSHEEARRVRAAVNTRLEERAERRRVFWRSIATSVFKFLAAVGFIAIALLLTKAFEVCS